MRDKGGEGAEIGLGCKGLSLSKMTKMKGRVAVGWWGVGVGIANDLGRAYEEKKVKNISFRSQACTTGQKFLARTCEIHT